MRGFCKEHKSLKKEEKELEKLAKFLTMTKLFSPRKKNKEQKRDLKRPREEEKEEGKVEMMEKKEKKAVAEADEVILHAELVEETAGKKPSKRRRFS